MHLFLYSIIPDIDTLTPVIDCIKKKNKIMFRSTNIINDYSEHPLFTLLNHENISLSNKPLLNLKGYIIYILIKFFNYLPVFIQDKLSFFTQFLYYNFEPFSKKYLLKFLKKNNIKTINIDDGCSENIIKILSKAAKDRNIPIIMYQVGLFILKSHQIKINKNISYFHSKHNFSERPKFLKSYKTSLIFHGFPRFTNIWIEKMKKISKVNKDNNKDNLKISIFTRPRKNILSKKNNIINKIHKLDEVKLILKNKPRYIMTKKQEKKHSDDYTTSELIDWSDIIICHNTSIIAEMLIKEKPIFFLNYLSPHDEYYYLLKYNCVNLINSEDEMLDLINIFKNNKYLLKDYIHNSLNYLKDVVNDNLNNKTISKNYNEFYSKF
jgi:hypothetical protein